MNNYTNIDAGVARQWLPTVIARYEKGYNSASSPSEKAYFLRLREAAQNKLLSLSHGKKRAIC